MRWPCSTLSNSRYSLVFASSFFDTLSNPTSITYDTPWQVCYVLSQPPPEWSGIAGRVDKDILSKYLPPPDLPGSFVMVCGPPGMTKSLGGVFDVTTMSKGPGILSEIGFDKTTMHIFE